MNDERQRDHHADSDNRATNKNVRLLFNGRGYVIPSPVKYIDKSGQGALHKHIIVDGE